MRRAIANTYVSKNDSILHLVFEQYAKHYLVINQYLVESQGLIKNMIGLIKSCLINLRFNNYKNRIS